MTHRYSRWDETLKYLRNCDGIIFDQDGTLVEYGPGVNDIYQKVIAQTAIDLGVKMDFPKALKAAQESYDRYHLGYRVFVEDHGLSLQTIHSAVYEKLTSDELFPKLVQKTEKTEETRALLEEIHEKLELPMYILTHASRAYAKRTVETVGFSMFSDQHIYAAEDTFYEQKNLSTFPYEIIEGDTELNLYNTIFVEDSLANGLYSSDRLRMPVFMVGKLRQSYTFWGNEWIWHRSATIQDFLKLLLVANGPKPPPSCPTKKYCVQGYEGKEYICPTRVNDRSAGFNGLKSLSPVF